MKPPSRGWQVASAVVIASLIGCHSNGGKASSSSAASASASSTSSTGSATAGSTGAATSSAGSLSTTGGGSSTGSCPAPPNELCGKATVLTLGTLFDGGDTTCSANDYSPSDPTCVGANPTIADGPDVVFAFSPATSGWYQVVVTPSGWTPLVYMTAGCPAVGTSIDFCPASSYADIAGQPQSFAAPMSADAGYFIFVDGRTSEDKGPFSIAVNPAPAPPTNSGCPAADAGAATLTVHAPGDSQTVTGDTTSAQDNNQSLLCSAGSGPDVVFAVEPSQAVSLVATIHLADGGNDPRQLIYLQMPPCHTADAGTAQELACNPVGNSFAIGDLPALDGGGAYQLWVDGRSGFLGPFELRVTLGPPQSPPPNATCASPAALVLADAGSGGLAASAAFDTTWSSDSTASWVDGGCRGYGGTGARDEVFSVVLPTPVPSLTAWIAPSPDGGLWTGTPLLYARSSCGDPSTELACGDLFATSDGGAWIHTGALDAGTTFLWIDGYPGGPGTLQVTVP